MHFILLLKIIFAVGSHLPVAPPSAWERKRNIEKQLKNICAVQLRLLFWALPGMNLVSRSTYRWGIVFPFVSGKVAEGTGCSCPVSELHFQGARATQNYRPSKDQRQRKEKTKTKKTSPLARPLVRSDPLQK